MIDKWDFGHYVVDGISLEEEVERCIREKIPRDTEVVLNYKFSFKKEEGELCDHGYELPQHYHMNGHYCATGVALVPKQKSKAKWADKKHNR